MGAFRRKHISKNTEKLTDLSQLIDDAEKNSEHHAENESTDESVKEDDRWSMINDDTWLDGWRTAAYKSKDISDAENDGKFSHEDSVQEEWDLPVRHSDPTDGKPRKKKKRRKKHYLLKLLIMIIVVICAYEVLTSSIFDIKRISVNDCRYYTKEQIIEKSGIKAGNNMFKTSTRRASEKLLEEPYIKEVKIKRKPPSVVEISILERREFASVPLSKKYAVIDDDGMVLSIAETPPQVPLIEGVKVKKAKVGSALVTETNSMYSSMIRILKAAEKNEITIKKIGADKAVLKIYVYDSLCIVGTGKNILKNIGGIDKVLKNMATQNIVRGTLKVSGGNTFPYSPIVEEPVVQTQKDMQQTPPQPASTQTNQENQNVQQQTQP